LYMRNAYNGYAQLAEITLICYSMTCTFTLVFNAHTIRYTHLDTCTGLRQLLPRPLQLPYLAQIVEQLLKRGRWVLSRQVLVSVHVARCRASC